jgi:hypothetical protein
MEGIETVDELGVEDARELTYEMDATITPELAKELAPLAGEAPAHKAVCMVDGCPAEVVYKLTASGAGFMVLERRGMDLDATLGMGAGGRPICPISDHGEMTLADETIPAADAFAQVAQKLDAPVQGDLPGIIRAFNYQGCYLELEEKAAEVDALHDEYIDAKEVAADAKKAWDKAAELYTKMALEFRRRRQSKGDDSPSLAEPPSRALACVWNKAHPDEACPFCDTTLSIAQRGAIVRVLGEEILPTEANGHADQVLTYRTNLDVAETIDALADLIANVPAAVVAEWTPEQRAEARAWATAAGEATDVESEPPFPPALGLPHIAAAVPDGAKVQTCETCGGVVMQLNELNSAFMAGDFVRLDCAGTDVEGHRYPDTAKPKKAARPKAEKPEKPAKKKAASKKTKGGR